ncbi:MAG: hypothetical protein AAB519_02925 [Patescibacteria group bacterium]
MSQKQIVMVVAGLAVAGLLGILVYKFYAGQQKDQMTSSEVPTGHTTQNTPAAEVPSSVNSVTETIQAETEMDLSALEDESAGETAEIKADSESVNNLGTSYDENAY